jgi:hypothetical protein
VRVEPDDARRRFVEARRHAHRGVAAARQDDREGAVVARGTHALGDLAHEVEARIDLAREAPLEQHGLGLDRRAV